jgi:glycine/D-amino acid oxidase-like deaminating enzyme
MNMTTGVLVIGTGLFGRIIGKALERQGHVVTYIDSGKEGAGSKPAACLMKPSWFSSLGKDVYDPALALLDDLYGVQELKFKVGPAKVGGIMWIPPREILQPGEDITGEVETVTPDLALLKGGGVIKFNLCIIAAGVWSSALANVPGLKGQAGAAFTWETPPGFEFTPFVRPWAPYRQLVAFMRDERELWVGDGTAIKSENWTREREIVSMHRCADAISLKSMPSKTLFGIRPYVPKAKPAFLDRPSRNVWVATGGAKNGTLAAGWCAWKIARTMA